MKRAISAALALFMVMTLLPAASTAVYAQTQSEETVEMNRLYNPNSGEHFYTASQNEKTTLISYGWKDEGVGWIAPKSSSKPVYRLYNPNAGDHHYTMNEYERDELKKAGWRDEGTGWFSDESESVPVYRQYNPNAVTGSHNYTTSKNENDTLKILGWNEEGIGWYACSGKQADGNQDSAKPEDPADNENPESPEDPVNPEEPAEPETPETPSDPAGPEVPEVTLRPDQQHARDYSYDFFVIPETIYSGMTIPVFIKTDDPTDFVRSEAVDEETGEEYYLGLTISSKSGSMSRVQMNMKNWKNSGAVNWYYLEETGYTYVTNTGKVDGGFLVFVSFNEPGIYEVDLGLNYEFYYSTKITSKTVVVEDTAAAEEEWIDSVLELYTTDEMDPFDKMKAVSSYLLRTFKYTKNDEDGYVYLMEDAGIPCFMLQEWNSCESPAYLCMFAEKIGGFDEIYNCFGDYYETYDDWMKWHQKCRVTIGDDVRYYSACPTKDTNYCYEYEMFDYSKY